MGMDLLDIVSGVERQFGIQFELEDMKNDFVSHEFDCTAEMLHLTVCKKCRAQGVPVPRSSWTRIRWVLANALGCRVKDIKRDAWLRRNLGCE